MTPRQEILLGERCRYCKQPLDNPDDRPGPRTCGECREELRESYEYERPEREDDE